MDRPARLPGRQRSVVRVWPDGPEVVANLERPRDDLVLERRAADGSFEQAAGPFLAYRRTIEPIDDGRRTWRETTTIRWSLPWFAWVFALPLRWSLAR